MRRSVSILCLALAAVLAAGAAEVQVLALDADLEEPLEGVRLQGAGLRGVSTDAAGRALVPIPSEVQRLAVTATLPGYEPLKFWVKAGEGPITIKLSIAEVIEGKELVVERAKPQKTDAQAGVSQVASREEIKSTAEIGLVEDVMSTIKTLPGVGYSGGWNAMPSIRGGDPAETTCVLDGAYVLYPYFWGGAYSIFDPAMAESAKLSNGLIPVRYGRVMSGLLEVTSKTPTSTTPRFDFSISTTGVDFFAQGKIGPTLGLFAGGKVTWMELPFALTGANNPFDVVPYIREGYAKLSWRPSDRIEWYFNSFVGSDGVRVSIDSKNQDESISTSGYFDWKSLSIMETTGLKLLLADRSLVELLLSYDRQVMDISFRSTSSGTRAYDQAFMSANSALLGGATSFTLDDLSAGMDGTTTAETLQGKASWDLQVGEGQLLAFGAEGLLEILRDKERGSGWYDFEISPGNYIYNHAAWDLDIPGNRALNSGAFALYDFDFGKGLVTGEAGFRADHIYFYSRGFSLNTYPTFNPRVRVAVSPWRGSGWADNLSLTAGSGLYAQLPLTSMLFDEKYGLADYSVRPSRAWFNVLGLEYLGPEGWKVSLEGYYKLYFDRFYVVGDERVTPVTYEVRNDGEGFAWGGDLMVQKKSGRFWDGWLTYSYMVARYRNPMEPAYPGQSTVGSMGGGGYPLGRWYYPSFHRFHSLNLILTWRPKRGFSAMLKASVATGAPKSAVGDIVSYPATYVDGDGDSQVIERFKRDTRYSDSLRNDISCPVDVKLTWSGYYRGSKTRWEYYVGFENVFANLYTPKTNSSFDSWTGKELSGGQAADFTIGFPVPSFGYKLSY